REAETTMVVQDGSTVLIGGIIDDAINGARTGVPYLMDVPVLGRFFRKDSDMTTRTELLITITPYVVHNREEAQQVTDDFSSRIEGLAELRRAMDSRRRRGRDRGPAPPPGAGPQHPAQRGPVDGAVPRPRREGGGVQTADPSGSV